MNRETCKLSVSIVSHFSDRAALRATLDSLEQSIDLAIAAGLLGIADIMIVDNSESAAESAALQSMFTRESSANIRVRVLRISNRGYGAANNCALAASDSHMHLVLNPDVVLDRMAITHALQHLEEEPECSLITPWAESPDGQRQYVAKAMPGVLTLLLRALPVSDALRDRFGNAQYELRSQLQETRVKGSFLAGGCFMLCRADALRAVGGFDERYFMYFEDFDLSRRLDQRGGRILFCPDVRITHGGGHASRKGVRHIGWFAHSALRFFMTHGWRWTS